MVLVDVLPVQPIDHHPQSGIVGTLAVVGNLGLVPVTRLQETTAADTVIITIAAGHFTIRTTAVSTIVRAAAFPTTPPADNIMMSIDGITGAAITPAIAVMIVPRVLRMGIGAQSLHTAGDRNPTHVAVARTSTLTVHGRTTTTTTQLGGLAAMTPHGNSVQWPVPLSQKTRFRRRAISCNKLGASDFFRPTVICGCCTVTASSESTPPDYANSTSPC